MCSGYLCVHVCMCMRPCTYMCMCLSFSAHACVYVSENLYLCMHARLWQTVRLVRFLAEPIFSG